MKTRIKHLVLICLGWMFVALGIIGVILPLMPTTIFLILALACFTESSPRFHQMLLNHKWFGPPLRQWQQTHSMRRDIKKKAYLIIILSFAISIAAVWGRLWLQVMLFTIGLILLACLSRVKESD
ncbi:YbaN family protein [Methylophaga thalassica]|uniref:YbaN family protein n=1 Tax=Methylophaga aminisulfidivorans TaxID=230105 RepID=UPI003A8EA1A4